MDAIVAIVVAVFGIVGGVLPGTVQVGSTCGGKVYFSSVPTTVMKRTPVWTKDAKEPPFSPLVAWNLADAKRQQLVKNSDEWVWELDSIEIRPAADDRWYYEFRYHAQWQKGPTTGSPPSLILLVLMDGNVPEPMIWVRHEFMRAVRNGAFEVKYPSKPHMVPRDEDELGEVPWSKIPWRIRFRLIWRIVVAPKLIYRIEKLEVYKDRIWAEYVVTNFDAKRKYLKTQHLERPVSGMLAWDPFGMAWQVPRFSGCVLYSESNEYVSIEPTATVRYRAVLNCSPVTKALELADPPRSGWRPGRPDELTYVILGWSSAYTRLTPSTQEYEHVYALGYGRAAVKWFDKDSPASYRHGQRLYP